MKPFLKQLTHGRFSRGVTLLEMVVILAIIFILSIIGISTFNGLNNNQAVDKGALLVLSVLDEARSLTLASKNSTQYGAHFENIGVTLFVGPTYSPNNSSNKVNLLDSSVQISSINLSGGGSDVVFDRLTGATAKSGTIILSLTTDSSITKTVTIYSTGVSQF